MSPEQKVWSGRQMINQLRQDADDLLARIQDLQALLSESGPRSDISMIGGVPHRFYPGSGWVKDEGK
jgi:hypothetical protein